VCRLNGLASTRFRVPDVQQSFSDTNHLRSPPRMKLWPGQTQGSGVPASKGQAKRRNVLDTQASRQPHATVPTTLAVATSCEKKNVASDPLTLTNVGAREPEHDVGTLVSLFPI
jgi:hypothetical protein